MYDVIVIGGGPGGYLAAERAGARGMSVLLAEERRLGGVCLNEGCIPTKSLLNAMKLYAHGKESARFGVTSDGVRFDLAAAMAWKRKTVEALVKGVEYQMRRRKVEVAQAHAELEGAGRVRVDGKLLEARNVIVASGSSAATLPIPGARGANVVTSREILDVEKLPARLAVIGGGVVGMEFASFFSGLGVEVHVVEMLDTIVPSMDGEIARLLMKSIDAVSYHLGARVEEIDANGVRYAKDGRSEEVGAELVLMAVGRRPNVAGIGLDRAGVDFTPKGIRVNERMQTNVPGIYAVGDVTGESLLAHSAYRMAECAVNTIAGEPDRMRYAAIPWVVYTLPEASGCGLTEEQAAKEGRPVRTARLPMRSNGRFVAENPPGAPGLCKVLVDAKSEALLGVHLLGGVSSELIFGAAGMIESELRVREIKEIVFPHPSLSEIVKDTLWELEN